MATFSGDVQYSQNGTVTNPCIKWSTPREVHETDLAPAAPAILPVLSSGGASVLKEIGCRWDFHPCKFHGGHHRFYFYFDKHLILYSHTSNYHDYPDLLNFLSLPLCHSEMVSTCRACLFCYFHGIYELLLQRRAVSRCPSEAKEKNMLISRKDKYTILYTLYIYIIYIITCIYIYNSSLFNYFNLS